MTAKVASNRNYVYNFQYEDKTWYYWLAGIHHSEMHDSKAFMQKIEEAYGKLFDSIYESKYKDGFLQDRASAKYIPFTAMEGHKYRKSAEFRFMLVGRATNDWDEYRIHPDQPWSRKEFIESSMANLKNEKRTIVNKERHDRFEWIDIVDGSPRYKYRRGIDRKENTKPYYLKKSAFWDCSQMIWDQLHKELQPGEEIGWDDRWFEYIAWSNLYKICPRGTNPGSDLAKKELDACKDLLIAEIDYFTPTHILFITGFEGWFKEFAEKFQVEPTKNNEYVEATGTYKYHQDGSTAKIVIACRPETRPRGSYREQVCRCFE